MDHSSTGKLFTSTHTKAHWFDSLSNHAHLIALPRHVTMESQQEVLHIPFGRTFRNKIQSRMYIYFQKQLSLALIPDDYLRIVFSWVFFMRLSTLCLVRHGSYQLKHTPAATFEISPLIPVSPIMETWHFVTRQKIVFETPQRKTWVANRKRKKKRPAVHGWQRKWSRCEYAWIMLSE